MAKVRDFIGSYRLARLIRNGTSSQIWEAVQDANDKQVCDQAFERYGQRRQGRDCVFKERI
ncbi:MAG: hypothetical protein R3C05_13970 [Pirellulaceae bacterium]